MKQGIFITLEGGEGVGKTTQISLLKDKLLASGYDVVVTREPGGTPAAESIRNLVSDEKLGISLPPNSELMLFNAARASHMEEVIKPSLKAGKIVICDRFVDSTRVYQGILQSVDMDFIHQLDKRIIGKYMPDLTISLDIPAEVAMARVQKRGARDHYDKGDLSFYNELRAGFKTLAEQDKDRIKIVNAEGKAEVIADNIWQYVSNVIENKNV